MKGEKNQNLFDVRMEDENVWAMLEATWMVMRTIFSYTL